MNESNRTLQSAYIPLRLAYGLVPIAAGADKFVNLLADWKAYLPAFAADFLPISPGAFMMVVGVIEIVAGLLVLTALPRLGAYIVMGWLIAIAGVVAAAGYLDIAVRDLVMAVGAFSLAQIAAARGEALLPVHAGHSRERPHGVAA